MDRVSAIKIYYYYYYYYRAGLVEEMERRVKATWE